MARKPLHDRMRHLFNQARAGKFSLAELIDEGDKILVDYKNRHKGDAVQEVRDMLIGDATQRKEILTQLKAATPVKVIAQQFYEYCLMQDIELKATGKAAAYNTTLKALRNFHFHCMEYDAEQARKAAEAHKRRQDAMNDDDRKYKGNRPI